jgi:hypothetical protein
MDDLICLRCHLPIRRKLGCICTAPGWRIYDPQEAEYLKSSTPEFPLQWLIKFMDKRELFRFRGDFFAPAQNNENIKYIDELNHTYDLKVDYGEGTTYQIIRYHYSHFLKGIIKNQVDESIKLMRDNLSTVDKDSGKHLLHRYLKYFQSITNNIYLLEKPNPFSDAVIEALTPLKEYITIEEEYYFPETDWDDTIPIDYATMPLKQILKRIFFKITEAQLITLISEIEGAEQATDKIDPIYFIGKLDAFMGHIRKLREEGRILRKYYAPAISRNCYRKLTRFSDAVPIPEKYLKKH